MKRKLLITLIAILPLMLVISCGDKKPDASAYTEFCAEVAKCDKQLQSLPNGAEFCAKFMAGVEAKVGDKAREIKTCITNQSCENKNMAECIQLHAGTLMAPK